MTTRGRIAAVLIAGCALGAGGAIAGAGVIAAPARPDPADNVGR
jgi:hypothetical protein